MKPEHERLLNEIHSNPPSYDYVTATLGIDYALGTGRVGGKYAIAFNDLSETELRQLVDRVAAACEVMADVPRWLIQNLDPARAHVPGQPLPRNRHRPY